MFKSKRAVSAAAIIVFGTAFSMAYGATTSASAQISPMSAPVTTVAAVQPTVEPVETLLATVAAEPVAVASVDMVEPVPVATSLNGLVDSWQQNGSLDDQARCLATAVFFEARGEALAGQLAVANVVLSRARSGRFPDNLCEVILQPRQFSFVRQGKLPAVPQSRPAWQIAKAIAQIAMRDAWQDPSEGALFFHATHVSPNWGRKQIAQIGQHIFYR